MHAVKAAVFQVDVVYVGAVVERHNHYAVLAFLAGYVLHVDVAHCWIESALGDFFRFVVKVDFQHGFGALANLDVAHVNVFYHSSACRIGLYSQYAVKVGAVHLAVLNEHVVAASRYFRADYNAAVAVLHHAVAHYDVLAGQSGVASLAALAPVLVASALDGDAVVAGIEYAVFNQYVLA